MAPDTMQWHYAPKHKKKKKNAVLNCAPHGNERQELNLCNFHSVMSAHFSWCLYLHGKEFHSLSLWDIRKHLVREPCDKGFNSFSHFITHSSLKTEDVFPLLRCSHFLCCLCTLCFLLLPRMAFFICNSRFIMLTVFVSFTPSCFPSPESESFSFSFFFLPTFFFLYFAQISSGFSSKCWLCFWGFCISGLVKASKGFVFPWSGSKPSYLRKRKVHCERKFALFFGEKNKQQKLLMLW